MNSRSSNDRLIIPPLHEFTCTKRCNVGDTELTKPQVTKVELVPLNMAPDWYALSCRGRVLLHLTQPNQQDIAHNPETIPKQPPCNQNKRKSIPPRVRKRTLVPTQLHLKEE